MTPREKRERKRGDGRACAPTANRTEDAGISRFVARSRPPPVARPSSACAPPPAFGGGGGGVGTGRRATVAPSLFVRDDGSLQRAPATTTTTTVRGTAAPTQRRLLLLLSSFAAPPPTPTPQVTRVLYAGLPDHPGHDLHVTQSSGAGSVVCFTTGDRALSQRVVSNTKLFHITVSFGAASPARLALALAPHRPVASCAVRWFARGRDVDVGGDGRSVLVPCAAARRDARGPRSSLPSSLTQLVSRRLTCVVFSRRAAPVFPRAGLGRDVRSARAAAPLLHLPSAAAAARQARCTRSSRARATCRTPPSLRR